MKLIISLFMLVGLIGLPLLVQADYISDAGLDGTFESLVLGATVETGHPQFQQFGNASGGSGVVADSGALGVSGTTSGSNVLEVDCAAGSYSQMGVTFTEENYPPTDVELFYSFYLFYTAASEDQGYQMIRGSGVDTGAYRFNTPGFNPIPNETWVLIDMTKLNFDASDSTDFTRGPNGGLIAAPESGGLSHIGQRLGAGGGAAHTVYYDDFVLDIVPFVVPGPVAPASYFADWELY